MVERANTPFSNHYTTLNISPDCSDTDIKKAYRTLVKKYHPDHNSNPEAIKRFIQIQQAYEILSDADKRKDFDQFLAAQTSKKADKQSSAFSGTNSTSKGTRSHAQREQSSFSSMPPFWHQPPSSSNFTDLSKRMAKEAYRNAERYHLGTPYHYYNSWFFDWEAFLHLLWRSVFTLLGGLAEGIAIVGVISACIHGPVGGWGSTIIGLAIWIAIWGRVFYQSLIGFLEARADLMHSYNLFYECSHGFLVVERKPLKRKGTVTRVVRWTQLQEVGCRSYYEMWVVTNEGKEIHIYDNDLWRRALHEFIHLHSDYSVWQEHNTTTWYYNIGGQ